MITQNSALTRQPPRYDLLALGLIATLTTLVYWPGLSGPFVFDDFGTLSRLGDLGGVDSWQTFRAFVFGGDAGPTGRPLALLTFLLDATDWPADAGAFKRTNLLIHLACGGLLYLLTVEVLGWQNFETARARRLAVAAAALWLLHPFLVSTTLYAVQRMAQLATLFTFAGLLLYLKGRRLCGSRPLAGLLVMSGAIAGFTILAVLCKENGVLLPLLAGVLEFTVVSTDRRGAGRLNPFWVLVFLGLPALAVLGYLGSYVADAGLFAINEARGYSIYERLLTEARVLGSYLREWFLPSAYTSGVFQDHVQHSSGWLSPPTTLLTTLFHLAAISLAVAVRSRLPLAALAVLFFYLSHLIESTVINLELYFEHRNYLAAAFLYLPLLVLIDARLDRKAFVAATSVAAAVLAAFTASQSTAWSSYRSLVASAALAAPESARAQQQFAVELYNQGNPAEAVAVIETAIQRLPDNDALPLTRAILLCRIGELDADDLDALGRQLQDKPWDLRLLNAQETLFELVANDSCPAVSTADLNRLYESLEAHPANADPRRMHYFQLQYFLGLADLALEDPAAAVVHFRAALASRPSASRAMLMASILANAERYDDALAFTREATRLASAASGGALPDARVDLDEIRAFEDRLREAMHDASP